jgi:isopentenyl diphosphate isomerase/L-lactate dehydrogenase-like FMN-dependent dehydrogenase
VGKSRTSLAGAATGFCRRPELRPQLRATVLRAGDARIVTSAGAAAVQVSNHGGRLPEIVAAVEGSGAELRHAMTLAGARTVSEITNDLVA